MSWPHGLRYASEHFSARRLHLALYVASAAERTYRTLLSEARFMGGTPCRYPGKLCLGVRYAGLQYGNTPPTAYKRMIAGIEILA